MLVFILCIIAALAAGWTSEQKKEGRTLYGVVNNDLGEFGDRIDDVLIEDQNAGVLFLDHNAAHKMLLQGRIQCYVTIPEDFSERVKNHEYKDLVDLTVSTDSTYSAGVTESFVKAVLKLWYEQEAYYRVNKYLEEKGLVLTPENEKRFLDELEHVWETKVLLNVICDTPENPMLVKEYKVPDVAVCWYCALIPFYLVISCLWMLQDNYHNLLQRVCRSSSGPMGLLLSQSMASLIPSTLGLVLVMLMGGKISDFLSVFPAFLIYEIGCLGPALIFCSVFRNLATMLLISPTATLSAAAMSGLLMPLPDWAGFWVVLSRVFPGRNLYDILSGNGSYPAMIVTSLCWLSAGVLISTLIKRKVGR